MRSVARHPPAWGLAARALAPARVGAVIPPANIWSVDPDTRFVPAPPARPHVSDTPADTDHRVRVRPHLRDEDEVALGVRRHRVRVLRLRDFLDQRSEEHTSELQSRLHLVCRLLLEKKHTSELQSRLHLVCRLLLEKKNNAQATPRPPHTPPTSQTHHHCQRSSHPQSTLMS